MIELQIDTSAVSDAQELCRAHHGMQSSHRLGIGCPEVTAAIRHLVAEVAVRELELYGHPCAVDIGCTALRARVPAHELCRYCAREAAWRKLLAVAAVLDAAL